MTSMLKTRNTYRDERGFTLIETLVAMFSAVVVVGALYAILIVALDQTSEVTDMVQANQTGRTTMTKLVSELNSACISSGFSPIQKETLENAKEAKLIFVNAYGREAEIPTASVKKHEIIWEKGTGLLIDKTYVGSSLEKSEYKFSSTGTTVRLGENIAQRKVVEKGAEKTIPIFRYYKGSETSPSLGAEAGLSTLEEKTPLSGVTSEKGLSATEAGEAESVEINFSQVPLDKNAKENRTAAFKTQVTFSFSVPNAENPIKAKPCE
jgi:type II secretory pathway pseudopilin PulG